MKITPRIKGFICLTAHPEGCAKNVDDAIAFVKSKGAIKNGCKSALIIGSSTGYGLASRIAASFGCGADTVGVFFERGPDVERERPASAGWYNTAAFTRRAREAGLYAANINGDAFSDEVKQKAIEAIKKSPLGKVDLVVYSLASPRRTDPKTGEVYKSVLKTVGKPCVNKSLDTDKAQIIDVEVPVATDKEISDTVKVMGGEDWKLWMEALDKAGVIAEGCASVAYSYIGPELTYPIYREGSIGQAKKDLERVTQASSAIPVVPLYISILYKVMKKMGCHEDCTAQMQRLFATQLYNDSFADFDDEGRVRMDNYELSDEVQKQVFEIWPKVTTENLGELTDFEGYKKAFLGLFGFGVDGVDYNKDSDINVSID